MPPNNSSTNLILAVVGMPGSGKSETVAYLDKLSIPFVRFGKVTDEGLKEQGLPLTPENEQKFREEIRRKMGMEAYAIKAKPLIDKLLLEHRIIAIDGLYSWEEYKFLKKEFSNLTLIHMFAEPKIRYKRLTSREVRPVPIEKCRLRDIMEIEKLNKGGTIAIADYLIENNDDNIQNLHTKIDKLLQKIGI